MPWVGTTADVDDSDNHGHDSRATRTTHARGPISVACPTEETSDGYDSRSSDYLRHDNHQVTNRTVCALRQLLVMCWVMDDALGGYDSRGRLGLPAPGTTFG